MFGLITDRDQSNVDRLNELAAKGWLAMTQAEKAEWLGDPLTATDFDYTSAVNLLPYIGNIEYGASLIRRDDSVIAVATEDGNNLYSVIIIGDAKDFTDKKLTLSVDEIYSVGDGKPCLALCWHDSNGYDTAGAILDARGSLTFNTTENAQNRDFLALYVYSTTDTAVYAGAMTKYKKIMLELGDVHHEYVPYSSVLPTKATKGAYNYSDLNRVEQLVAEISESLRLGLVTRTWDIQDVPSVADMTRYLTNIATIRKVLPNKDQNHSLPEAMQNLTYMTANNIEKILLAAIKYQKGVYRTGELFCGEVVE